LTESKLQQNWAKGPKLQQKVNLRGPERVVYFRGQNHNFGKLRGPKV